MFTRAGVCGVPIFRSKVKVTRHQNITENWGQMKRRHRLQTRSTYATVRPNLLSALEHEMLHNWTDGRAYHVIVSALGGDVFLFLTGLL